MGRRKAAVFIDAENVSPKAAPSVLAQVYARWDVCILRAYADWSIGQTCNWKRQFTSTPMIAIQQFHDPKGSGKMKRKYNTADQAVDKVIIMDAIEIAIKNDRITDIIIVASDNGYHSLALRLKELGKYVVGVGERSKSRPIWIQSCNEFIYIEDSWQVKIVTFPYEKEPSTCDKQNTLANNANTTNDAALKVEDETAPTAKLPAPHNKIIQNGEYSDYGVYVVRPVHTH